MAITEDAGRVRSGLFTQMTVGYDRFRECRCGGEDVLGFQEIHHQDGRYRLLSNGPL
jgi:hypothetical protein